ncbi:alpha-glucosidase [Saccharopolyspora lacisalsi]|uniref:Alpha-glucosidase n=1 Tax=Halosaccharopolyspora lacisalsi TaxID=1000566 RepID=A0A839DWD4_9PSEU|nr:glycoside hydrolase family 97 protein [Halosaccharopolyspora lacisalsi]MBA8825200.1 alpha-glucosidase [Halosaccharopolyspora lacisalsi]
MSEGISRRTFVAGTGMTAAGWAVASAASFAPVTAAESRGEPVVVESPDGKVRLLFRVADGRPQYSVSRAGRTALSWSAMGFELGDGAVLGEGMKLAGVHRDELDETWQPVWGARAEVRSHCNRAVLRLRKPGQGGELAVEFRVFDDGLGFRYLFGAEAGEFDVLDELTEFRFTDDHTAWSIPGNYDSYEYLHTETPLTGIGGLADWQEPRDDPGQRLGTAATPLTVKVAEDLYLALHEAALHDFPEMTLAKIDGGPQLRSALAPLKNKGRTKAHLGGPFATPWRTFVLAEHPGDLIESHLVLNLNEPCAIEDTSWIRPATYVGVWWSIHKGRNTWAPGPDLGATTENVMRYMDFAAENGASYVLAEGWNKGWTDGEGEDFDNRQDFLTPNPQFDLRRVVEYGRERGVEFLAHNETGGGVDNYEKQLDRAFAKYERLGLPGVKTGYAGVIEPHYHHDQWMVRHYQRVVEKAAEHRLMINAHEPIKGTGIERTYPNFVSREGVKGQEYEAWSRGNPPEHTVTLPFTRMLAGPLDYTPGIFDITWFPPQSPEDPHGADNDRTRVHTTRAHQIALYPVLLSGVQMLADVPENYRGAPEFEFLRSVPATWDETRVVDGAIGDYVSVARRSGREWYVGTLTDERARTVEVPLDFLGEGTYVAHCYTDAPDTDLESNPNAVATSRRLVDASTTVHAEMTNGSGHSMRIVPATDDDESESDNHSR